MPALIVIENSYSNEDAIERIAYYILNPWKTPGYYVSGHAVNLMNADSIITSFRLIKSIYGKLDGRQVRHMIVSFADYEGITCEDAYRIQSAAISYFRELGYQAISAVHVPKIKGDHIHFHLAINTVNLYTGQKYSGTYTQRQEFFEYLKNLENDGLTWDIKPKYVNSLEEELSLI